MGFFAKIGQATNRAADQDPGLVKKAQRSLIKMWVRTESLLPGNYSDWNHLALLEVNRNFIILSYQSNILDKWILDDLSWHMNSKMLLGKVKANAPSISMRYKFLCLRSTKKSREVLFLHSTEMNSVGWSRVILDPVPTQKQTTPLIFYNLKEWLRYFAAIFS